jgi:hypothetical protein
MRKKDECEKNKGKKDTLSWKNAGAKLAVPLINDKSNFIQEKVLGFAKGTCNVTSKPSD